MRLDFDAYYSIGLVNISTYKEKKQYLFRNVREWNN